MANLMIVRGLPGSGKSTFVKNNYPGLFYLETDMFNIENGQYIWTIDRAKQAIQNIEDISNILLNRDYKMDMAHVGVFGNPLSFSSYVYEAFCNGYEIYIKTLTTQFKTIHQVPEETFKNMMKMFTSDEDVKKILSATYPSEVMQKIHFCEMPKLKFG